MISKTQLKLYNDFLNSIYNNIYNKVYNEKNLNIEKIQEIISDKNGIINSIKYNGFLEIAYKSNFLSYDKNILKNYIDSYLEKYITTLTKNIVVKYYYELVNNNKATYNDIINIFFFLNIFFRYKNNNDIFNNVKDIILENGNIDKVLKEILSALKEYYKKTNYQNNSIFKNQLIKFLKQKQNKEKKKETKFMSDNYEIDLISFQNIKGKGNDYHSIPLWGDDYEKLKAEIIDELIIKYKRKRKIDYEKLSNDIIKIAYELGDKKNIDTSNNFFSNFIQEFKETISGKIKSFL